MPSPKVALLLLLGVFCAVYVAFWWRRLRATGEHGWPSRGHLAIGALTNFFDTLGVGSFATTTALYKLRGLRTSSSRARSTPGTRCRRWCRL